MNIKDNIIKKKLENVYFIAGTNCGGKSSMARALSEKHDMLLYSADEHYWNHRPLSDTHNQPNMNRPFYNWEEYFNRDPQEQARWLLASEREEMDFIILDLLALADRTSKKIIVDIHRDVDLFNAISEYNRVAFLVADIAVIQKQFFQREDKADLLQCIQRETSDPQKAIANVQEVAKYVATEELRNARESGFFVHERTEDSSFEERLALVEQHFGLVPQKNTGISVQLSNKEFLFNENNPVAADELIAVFNAVGWSKDPQNICQAFEASQYYTCYHDGKLVAFARVITDNHYYANVFDVVVLPDYQRLGIGKQFMDMILEKYKGYYFFLTHTEGKQNFYTKCGFLPNPCGMWIPK